MGELDFLLDPYADGADLTKVCEMGLSLYERILALPGDSGTALIRIMLVQDLG